VRRGHHPHVVGTVDQAALAALAAELLAGLAEGCACGRGAAGGQGGGNRNRHDGDQCRCADTGPPGRTGVAGHPGPRAAPHPTALARLHEILLRHAADVLSGPGGLAAFLRTRLTGDQVPSVSLPLDTGTPASLITGALRRAVITRDRHCAFPGCDTPPAACQVHHIKERAKGGQTSLTNLVLLCAFHHLIAVHQWGWTLTLHADGTVTAVSPDRTRTLHSHGPPQRRLSAAPLRRGERRCFT
jgi:HNH endonuclease